MHSPIKRQISAWIFWSLVRQCSKSSQPGKRDLAFSAATFLFCGLAEVLDSNPQLIWASHYLSALAKALVDDAELGMNH